jgi:HTH-type transcriptional regulator, competence development regulator
MSKGGSNRHSGDGGRSSRVLLTPAARVLKRLREKKNLSMRELGQILGVSDSYVSQVENGRANVPEGARLEEWLKPLGAPSLKYFGELCRDWEKEKSEIERIEELLPKLKPRDLKIVLKLAQALAADDFG